MRRSKIVPLGLAALVAGGALVVAGPASAAGDACPNAAVRAQQQATFLPGCRAYEKVSPAAKGNGDISYFLDSGSSTAGDAMIFSSVAGFADPVANARANNFLARRGATGWSSRSLTPRQAPDFLAGLFLNYAPFDYSDDLSKGVIVNGSDPNDPDAVHATKELYVQDTAARSYAQLSPPPAADPGPFAYQPNYVSASTDFRHVAFQANEPRTPDSPAGAATYLYMWDDGVLRVVGGALAADGVRGVAPGPEGWLGLPSTSAAAGSNALHRSMSPDGSQLVFASGSPSQLWLDVRGSAPRQISLSQPAGAQHNSDGDPAPHGATFQGTIAKSGRLQTIFFTSQDALTEDARSGSEPNHSNYTTSELYAYDVASRSLSSVAPDDAPDHAAGAVVQRILAASADGSVLYFIARPDLVPGHPNPGNTGLYRWQDGHPIEALGSVDEFSNATSANSWMPERDLVWASADGRRLAILTADRLSGPPTTLDPYSGAAFRRMNVYTAGSGWECVSCRPDGQPTAAGTWFRNQLPGPSPQTAPRTRVMSEDGRRVFFEAAESLVPEDVNGLIDVYVWDDGVARLLSSGRGRYDSHLLDASASGDDVFIATRNPLVAADRDDNIDAYDVRVNGGFPEPDERRPCDGDACQAPPLTSQAGPAIGSASFGGDGNVSAVRPRVKPSVRIVRAAPVVGAVARLRVRVPGAGRVLASGASLQQTTVTVSKAGTYTVTIALSARAKKTLKRRQRLAAGVRVSYRTKDGRAASQRVVVSFKQPQAKRAQRKGSR